MSQWGNKDRIDISSVAVLEGETTVSSSVLDFNSANVVAGDTIFLANVAYKVASITDSGNLELDVAYEDSDGTVDAYIQQSPKDLSTYGFGGNATTRANVVNARNVFGVDRVEVEVTENKNRGISHTGWVHHRSYTDGQGSARNKSEVLVAMSKNFASNASGTLFGIGAGLDARDDTVLADYRLVFTAQPTGQSNTESNIVVFSATAASVPSGASLTYQWFASADGDTYAQVLDGDLYSGNTTNTLEVSNVSAVDGYYFKLTVSTVDGGADSNTSTAVTATEV